jgi:4-amino-4-deoxy-L-arabinose transferase-like glycosyltransferase
MRAAIRNQLIVVLAAGAMFFTGLGASRLWDNDEPKNAVCAREMIDRGDWIVPTFNGQLRTDKPALLYWLMIPAYRALGVNEFAARLPSALLAVGTCWLVYHLGRMLFRPQVGLWAALIMATNVQFCIAARWATPDSTLVFCTTLALAAYVWCMAGGKDGGFLAVTQPSTNQFRELMPRTRLGWAAVCCAMGLAVLAKGPIGVVAPAGSLLLFILAAGVAAPEARPLEHATLSGVLVNTTQRAIRWLKDCFVALPAAIVALRPITLIAVVAAVSGPWYAAVASKTNGEWLNAFLWRHNVGRFLEPMEGHHGWWAYQIGMLVICFFPWVFILPPAIAALVKRIRVADAHARSLLLMACWAIVWIGLFSVARTKLPNYVLPAYPALALVCGFWVADFIALSKPFALRWLSAGWLFLALIGLGVVIAAAATRQHLLHDHAAIAGVGGLAIVGAAVGWQLHRRRQAGAAMATVVATITAATVVVFTLIAPAVSRHQNGPMLSETLAGLSERATGLGAFQMRSPSAVFCTGETISELRNPAELTQFFTAGSRQIVMTDEDGLRVISGLFPGRAKVIDCQHGFPNKGPFIVVGLARDAAIASGASKQIK